MQPLLRNSSIPVTHIDAGLRITEIFMSLQGEALYSGLPTVFIRLTGCPLRCTYCDTAYAFEGGTRVSIESIALQVQSYSQRYAHMHVCVTGGEPLAQPNCLPLLTVLCDLGYKVSLETSGALDVSQVDPRVSKVLDLKTPSSGEDHQNLWANLAHLSPTDQIKIVIANRSDYIWAINQLRKHALHTLTPHVSFSPVFDITAGNTHVLPPLAAQLADWMLADHIPARLGLQLHKLLWHDATGK